MSRQRKRAPFVGRSSDELLERDLPRGTKSAAPRSTAAANIIGAPATELVSASRVTHRAVITNPDSPDAGAPAAVRCCAAACSVEKADIGTAFAQLRRQP